MSGVPAMIFREGETVQLIGSGERIMCQGIVRDDPGPPGFVVVQYALGGKTYVQSRPRKSILPLKKVRRDEPIEDAQTTGQDSGGSGADSARSDDREGRSEVKSGRSRALLPGGSEGLAASERDGTDADGDSERSRDSAGPRAHEPEDEDRARGSDHRGSGARATATTESEQWAPWLEAKETPQSNGSSGSATTTATEAAIVRAADHCRIAAQKAVLRYPPYNSAHEAYGVLVEEVAEFFDEVRKKDHLRSRLRLKNEAIDIAVVAIRIAAMYEDPR